MFFWDDLERQIRASGRVEKLSIEQSKTYFHSRPKDSQLAAWVSNPQSGVVQRREIMDNKFASLSKESIETVDLPDYWGGYKLIVDSIEFW